MRLLKEPGKYHASDLGDMDALLAFSPIAKTSENKPQNVYIYIFIHVCIYIYGRLPTRSEEGFDK